MPKLINYLPFPNFRYYSSDNKGEDFGVIIVKGTFEIKPDGQLAVAEEQAPMVFSDRCHGELNLSSLWHPSDLVPAKPHADIIVSAVARAPGGKPTRCWNCGISVSGSDGVLVDKRLRVTGPRWWVPVWNVTLREEDQRHWRHHRKWFSRWELSEPEVACEVPLHFELAYGGTVDAGAKDGEPVFECDGRNPIGRGLILHEWTDHTVPQPAPQIEAADEPISDPYKKYAPESLGPIPPAWDPRLPLGGTFDQHWEDHIWPNWPADYDLAYNNSAPPHMQLKRYLSVGDRIRLDNLFEGAERMTITLPDVRPRAVMIQADGTRDDHAMSCDTCFLDIGKRARDARVFLSWRAQFQPDKFLKAVLIEEDHYTWISGVMEQREFS